MAYTPFSQEEQKAAEEKFSAYKEYFQVLEKELENMILIGNFENVKRLKLERDALFHKINYLEWKLHKNRQKTQEKKSLDRTMVTNQTLETTQPLIFSLEKSADLKKQNDSDNNVGDEFYLYACEVMHDGLGDLGHFIEISKEHGNNDGLEKYRPLYVVKYEKEDDKDKIINELKENGFDISSDNFHLIPPNTRVSNYINSNALFQNQILRTKAMLNISTIYFDPPRNPFKTANHGKEIPGITIGEHHTKMRVLKPKQTRHMGFGADFWGILLHKYKDKNPNAPVRALTSINNKQFLEVLFGKQINKEQGINLMDTKQKEELATSFLQNSLLIPGYYHSESFLANAIKGVSQAPVAASFKEIVFIANKENTYDDINQYIPMMGDNIREISITTQKGDQLFERTIMNPNFDKDQKGISVRIVEGFWLAKHEYQSLYQAAPLFGGAAGDKSFENLISYDLIPLLQVMAWKEEFIAALAELSKAVLSEELPSGKKDLITPFLLGLKESKVESELLVPEFQQQWSLVADFIKEKYNLFDLLPKIKQESLELALEREQTKQLKF